MSANVPTAIAKRAWRDRYATRTPIIGTDRVVYSAWTLAPRGTEPSHSTVSHLDPESPAWFGRIGTERLPDRIERLAAGAGRAREHEVWRRGTYDLAYEVIVAAFPELAEEHLYEAKAGPRARREDGRIVEWVR